MQQCVLPSMNTDLSEITRQPCSHSKIFAIASGKGGVGKTTIAVNFALSLSAAHNKTLLFDADFSLGNIDLVANVNHRHNVCHVLDGRKKLEDVINTGPNGLEVICASSGLEQFANPTNDQRHLLIEQLNNLREQFDSIVIDTAAGISTAVTDLCLLADEVIIVTTPQPASITDAYATAKVLKRQNYPGRVNMLVNMASSVDLGKKTYHKIAKVARQFLNMNIAYAGTIVDDYRITTSAKSRQPFVVSHPKAPAAMCLNAIARRVTANNRTESEPVGILSKVADWFF